MGEIDHARRVHIALLFI